jgi:hypothetical protein
MLRCWPRGLSLIRSSHMSEIFVKSKSWRSSTWFSPSCTVLQIAAVKRHSMHKGRAVSGARRHSWHIGAWANGQHVNREDLAMPSQTCKNLALWLCLGEPYLLWTESYMFLWMIFSLRGQGRRQGGRAGARPPPMVGPPQHFAAGCTWHALIARED